MSNVISSDLCHQTSNLKKKFLMVRAVALKNAEGMYHHYCIRMVRGFALTLF